MTSSGRKWPALQGDSGVVSDFSTNLLIVSVSPKGTLTGPRTASLEPVKSTRMPSPPIVTATFIAMRSSLTPSSSM